MCAIGLVDSALVTTENYETSSEYEGLSCGLRSRSLCELLSKVPLRPCLYSFLDSVCQNSAPPVSMEEGEVGKSSKGMYLIA